MSTVIFALDLETCSEYNATISSAIAGKRL